MKNVSIGFYEGSYCFKVSEQSDINLDFIEAKLAEQYNYRPTTEDLWAIVYHGGFEISRWEFKFGVGLKEIKLS